MNFVFLCVFFFGAYPPPPKKKKKKKLPGDSIHDPTWSPNVGGHLSNLLKSHVFTIPKKFTSRTARLVELWKFCSAENAPTWSRFQSHWQSLLHHPGTQQPTMELWKEVFGDEFRGSSWSSWGRSFFVIYWLIMFISIGMCFFFGVLLPLRRFWRWMGPHGSFFGEGIMLFLLMFIHHFLWSTIDKGEIQNKKMVKMVFFPVKQHLLV